MGSWTLLPFPRYPQHFFTQQPAQFCIVFSWIFRRQLLPPGFRPNHERVHRPPHMIRRLIPSWIPIFARGIQLLHHFLLKRLLLLMCLVMVEERRIEEERIERRRRRRHRDRNRNRHWRSTFQAENRRKNGRILLHPKIFCVFCRPNDVVAVFRRIFAHFPRKKENLCKICDDQRRSRRRRRAGRKRRKRRSAPVDFIESS